MIMLNFRSTEYSESIKKYQKYTSIYNFVLYRACYYNGVMGTYLKRSSGFFTLAPGEYEVLTLRLDPKEYESRMVDMGFVKLTSTAYVYETMHSFIDEYDFRFEKPYLHIEVRNSFNFLLSPYPCSKYIFYFEIQPIVVLC